MQKLSSCFFSNLALGFLAASLCLATTSAALAQETPAKDEGVYLDEPPEPPAPKVARQGPVTEKYEDGSVRVEREVMQLSDDTIVNNGKFVEYYRNKQKFAEGQFVNGVHDGEWTFWHENGTVAKKVKFLEGRPDGSWEVFRGDGSLMAKHGYKNGLREGTWTLYYDDGKTPKIVQTFVDGALDGVRTTYFENGKDHQKAVFAKGVLNGLMEEWDETGRKVGEANFEDGMLNGKLIRWGNDGTKFEQSYRDNQAVTDANPNKRLGPEEKPADAESEELRLMNK
jgi:antitoxin component YwqK of YwqJK toxin-antitoxin module